MKPEEDPRSDLAQAHRCYYIARQRYKPLSEEEQAYFDRLQAAVEEDIARDMQPLLEHLERLRVELGLP